MIIEAKPWFSGQTLTDTTGATFTATGAGSYKIPKPEVVAVEVEPDRQTHFCAGDTLPDWMSEKVEVCLIDGTLVDVYDGEELPEDTNGVVVVGAVTGKPAFSQKAVKIADQRQTVYDSDDTLPEWMTNKVKVCLLDESIVELCDSEEVPDNIGGTIVIDALTGVAVFNQGAKKPVPVVKPIVTQLDEPTKEDVESGVCIWRNQLDGCLYTVTVEDDGSCTWFSSDKNDTNTFATVIEAPAADVDDYGNQYSAGQDLIVFADNTVMALAVDTDTVDGYSEQGESDGTHLDAQGNPIPAGNKITTYYDANGAIVNSRDDEKTQGSTTTPSDDGLFHEIVTSDNRPTKVCVNQYKGLRDNGDGTKTEIFIDQAGKEVTGEVLDEPTQSGEPQLSTVDAAGNTTYVDADGATQTVPATDVNGDPVDPSQAVWNMIDGGGNYLGSKPCNPETALGVESQDGVVWDVNPLTNNSVAPETCYVQTELCDPENGNAIVIIVRDVGAGTVKRFNKDLTDFVGDASTLVPCASVTDLTCQDGSIRVSKSDGSSFRFQSKFKHVSAQSTYLDERIDDTTPANAEIAESVVCADYTTGDCEEEVRIECYEGFRQTRDSTTATGLKRVFLRLQYSINGGANWSLFPTGAAAQLYPSSGPTAASHQDESSFHGIAYATIPANTTVSICKRLFVQINDSLDGAEYQLSASNLEITGTHIECCDVIEAS